MVEFQFVHIIIITQTLSDEQDENVYYNLFLSCPHISKYKAFAYITLLYHHHKLLIAVGFKFVLLFQYQLNMNVRSLACSAVRPTAQSVCLQLVYVMATRIVMINLMRSIAVSMEKLLYYVGLAIIVSILILTDHSYLLWNGCYFILQRYMYKKDKNGCIL